MKKISLILLILFIILNNNISNALDSLNVSAIVGNSNHAPIITSVVPDSNPLYLSHSNGVLVKQNYSIKYRDDEKDEVTYTITTETNWWAVNPTNWTILTSSYDINNEAYIFFEYIAPTSDVWSKIITITISDWPNVTVKTLNVYIY